MAKNRAISKKHVEGNIKRDGYSIFRSFFDYAEVQKIFESLRANEKSVVSKLKLEISANPDLKGVAIENDSLKYLKNPNHWFPELKKLLQSKLFVLANELTGLDFYLNNFELHQKFPNTSGTPPHQDNFYFGLDLTKNFACTAYVALNKQTADQGSLGFYPASHLRSLEHHRSQNIGFSSGVEQDDLAEYQLYNPDFKPGDVLFHHCNIVHVAGQNTTRDVRSNVAIRLFPVNEIIDPALKEKYFLLNKNSIRMG